MKLSVSKLHIFLAVLVWLIFSACPVFPAESGSRDREPAFRDNFYDVAVCGNLAWIVGYYGTILRSRDRGLTWELQQSGTTEALFRVIFRGDKDGWISGSYGTLLRTQDGGKSWQKQKTPVEEQLFGLDFIDERRGWAVGSRGTVLITEDGGVTWVSHGIGEDVILNDVRFLDAKQGWAVGEFGRIYRSKDSGRTWVKQKSPVEVPFTSGESRNLFRLLFSNGPAGWAFGLDGVILKTQNGEKWDVANPNSASSPNVKRNHLFAASAFDGKSWAVGERGTVLVSALSDNQWDPVELKTPPLSLNGIAFGKDSLGLIVGNRGVILRTDNAGWQWQQIRLGRQAAQNGANSSR
jgi:photosystem II stability/assembly factor-like uncharacterized protein